MITLIDALARFPRQGRNEKHDTWTFKGDPGGKQKCRMIQKQKPGEAELGGAACQRPDGWAPLID